MNYQVLIEQNIGTVYQAGIATKILQHMDRIRNVRDRNLILLSNEQMKAAVRKREQYVVLRVLYNYRNRQGEQILAFPDPVKQIENGVFTNSQSGYPFYVKENGEKN